MLLRDTHLPEKLPRPFEAEFDDGHMEQSSLFAVGSLATSRDLRLSCAGSASTLRPLGDPARHRFRLIERSRAPSSRAPLCPALRAQPLARLFPCGFREVRQLAFPLPRDAVSAPQLRLRDHAALCMVEGVLRHWLKAVFTSASSTSSVACGCGTIQFD